MEGFSEEVIFKLGLEIQGRANQANSEGVGQPRFQARITTCATALRQERGKTETSDGPGRQESDQRLLFLQQRVQALNAW